MDKSDEILEVIGFIKDRMVTKEDLKTALQPIKDELFAINGKLAGIDKRIDREAERNYEQDLRIANLEKRKA